MARKSRKYVIENSSSEIIKVAGYVRLSVSHEDGENTSIATQKLIIDEFVSNQPDMILEKWYVDEGASGSNFNRLAFQEMLEDLKSGKVSCIVVKDLSRFSRDFIGSGYYIEKYFPLNNIRFISIAENFDTKNDIYETGASMYPKHDYRLINALNEAVVKDISTKTSESLKVLAKEGCFLAPRAPYGYVKETKHKLGIDTVASCIVKRIFEMARQNVGITEITRTLNKDNILTPMEYAVSNGAKGNYNIGTSKWSTRTIKDMLTNITYAGHLCQGKDNITVLNTHDAIVDQSLFDEVQAILQNNTINRSKAPISENPIKGKVICGCCDSKMQRRKGSGNANWYYFTCITNNRQGWGNCEGMYIRESEIIDKIKQDINNFIIATEPRIKKMSAEKQELRKQRFMLDLEDARSRALWKSYYEQFCDGDISKEDFRAKADDLTYHTEEIVKLDKEVKELDDLREKYNFYVKVRDGKIDVGEFIEKWIKYFCIISKSDIEIIYFC